MAVPKRKTSKSKRNMRRNTHALKGVSISENSTSGELTLPHHVSPDGFYNGRQVLIAREADNDDESSEETL